MPPARVETEQMTQPQYHTRPSRWHDWTAFAERGFDLAEWKDATDHDATPSQATALTSLSVMDDGRTLKGVCPDNASAYNYCGFLREVPERDFIWGVRAVIRRIGVGPTTTSVTPFAYVCYVNHTDIGAYWYGAGFRYAGVADTNCWLQYGWGSAWNVENSTMGTRHYTTAVDVLMRRSGTTLETWATWPGEGWVDRFPATKTVSADAAALFGVRVMLGNGTTNCDVAMYLTAFREFDELPF